MKQSTIEKYEVKTSLNGWGNITTYDTNMGTFEVSRRNELDYYENPIMVIVPLGFVRELPKVKGFRRNNNHNYYTCQSYNFERDMEFFLEELAKQIEKGNKLYHN